MQCLTILSLQCNTVTYPLDLIKSRLKIQGEVALDQFQATYHLL